MNVWMLLAEFLFSTPSQLDSESNMFSVEMNAEAQKRVFVALVASLWLT